MFCPEPYFVQHHYMDEPSFQRIAAEHQFHIYMICRKPRITFDRSSVTYGEGTVSGKFVVHKRGERIDVPFTSPNSIRPPERDIVCEYPFTEVTVVDAQGQQVNRMLASDFFRGLRDCFHDPSQIEQLDMEVLYVGQAYGSDGNRTAPDRLRAHETLLAIHSQAAARSPDDEIWIGMLAFEAPWLIMSIDGREETATTLEEDAEHAGVLMSDPVSERQRICFAEAALIRYFQPEYNSMFKNVFPSPAHESYRECYEADLNAVSVELNFEEFPLRVYSPTVAADFVHYARFALNSPELRRSMFEDLV